MASSIFAGLVKRALRSKGEATQSALISSAMEQKGLTLKGTMVLRSEEEPTPEDMVRFQLAAEEYVERLIGNSLDETDINKFIRRTKVVQEEFDTKITTTYGIRDKKGRMMSALTLSRLLNLTLYKYAEKLMKSPRLVWRTGRLAHSGRVTSITPGSKGMGSIYFTYMLTPYSIFEPSSGSRLGSQERSPNKLFALAIRNALDDILSTKSTQFIIRSEHER